MVSFQLKFMRFMEELEFSFESKRFHPGMGHVTDTLWNAYLPKLRSARILVMGTAEAITTKIHVDHMIDRWLKLVQAFETNYVMDIVTTCKLLNENGHK